METEIKNKPSDEIDKTSEKELKLKKINKKSVIISVIAILAVVGLILFFTLNQTGQELVDLTYSIQSEQGTIIDSGTSTFNLGNVASTLGFATDKLDEDIETMKTGEEKTITLEPEDAYGGYDEELIFQYNRTEKNERENDINKTQLIPTAYFISTFNEQPIIGKEYSLSSSPWPYKVLDKDENNVKLSQEAKVGQKIPTGFFVYEVTKVTDDKITLKLQGNDTTIPTPSGDWEIKFTSDYVITTLTPKIDDLIELQDLPKARVTKLDENYIYLDANQEYAGKKIIIAIKLNNRFKEKTKTATTGTIIENAPTMQVFIMSYCPYGLQMLKGMLPVMEKFQGKANIELRFVGYTMHGEKEEQENYRMICIREEQSSKLILYLKCFAESGDFESCIAKANIDKTKLSSCMTSKASQYYEEDKALNEKYGVQGSPTTVIDGKVTEIWPRSPEDIKQKLCEAFMTKPAECTQTLSKENPSAGFGSGTSTTGSGGSCG